MFWADTMMSHLPPVSAGMIDVEHGVLDLHREPEPLGDLGGDVHVRADRVAGVVERLLRRVRDVDAHEQAAGHDELAVGNDGHRRGLGAR